MRSKLRGPSALLAALALGGLVGSVPTSTAADIPRQSCSDPTRQISLFAEKLGRDRIGYGLTPKSASIPGPTIQMTEGDCVAVNLVNDTNGRVSLHAHGVDYSPASDGTPHNLSCVPAHRSRTYVWSTHAPTVRQDGTVDPGSAGYWHYHDHCHGTPHGTGGIDAGLFGALIVRRAGDPVPDRPPFVVVFKDQTINLKKAPFTPIFKANLGERVEFVVIGHGNLFHTFHLHGHRWADTRTGTISSPDDTAPLIDNKTLGPADSFGFQIIAGEHVGQGAWMYHCHVQGHSDAGMTGLFVVRSAEGKMSPSTKAAVRRWKAMEGGGSHHHG
ncbi:MAG TPA: multicopper oxidase domain-containing protein [Actinomycetota bacterium]|nr:multicopper oxidase domain-containing protein [Actinomycetota bacterium]